jgi:hypothetical protein
VNKNDWNYWIYIMDYIMVCYWVFSRIN